MKGTTKEQYFVSRLLNWNEKQNTRQMPWKGEKDPYKIWLSEIILQQTRVEQGLSYYNRFLKAFPTVKHLAKAKEVQVFKLWEGLGYYTRCKNLIATAKNIANKLNGKFPDKYEDILALKGIGPYTAAAIGSFAFNIPKAVVDGNVFRVLARYFGIGTPIDSIDGKKEFSVLADGLLEKNKPGIYNQALMDFGAVVCKPKSPLCNSCPLNKKCMAFISNKVNELPLKGKSIAKKTRWFYYLILEYQGKYYIRKRAPKDIWENLYEFVLVEKSRHLPINELLASGEMKTVAGKSKLEIESVSRQYKQVLTHQVILGQFIKAKTNQQLKIKGFELAGKKELAGLPFPKFINQYLQDKTVPLNLL